MSFYPKLIGAVCGVCAAGALIYAGVSALDKAGVSADGILSSKPTLTVWYTEEKLEDYLSAMALEYQDATGVRVVPVLKSGLEYLEAVNDASIAEESMPDVYLISNDGLEKAYLAGLAVNVKDQNAVLNTENFPQTALDAVTYQGHAVAYPLYFETSALVYNQTYLEQAAAELETDEVSLIPKTIDDIRNFADEYNAPETVESVFRWDVSDFFYNYFFVGNYIDVGGEDGDNNANFNIFNQETIDCLQVYQDLNQFFSIDTKEVTYDKILQEFIEGKTVFTVATTDAIEKIEEAKAAGNFSYEYGVAVLPDLSSKLKARGLSVTNAVAINGYSGRKEDANAFERYLTYTDLDTLYNRSGKIACRYDVEYDNPEISNTMLEYQKSVSLPKMIEASNFWVQLEIAFTKVWTGSDPEEELRALSELIGSQIDEIGYTIPTQESISAGADEAVK